MVGSKIDSTNKIKRKPLTLTAEVTPKMLWTSYCFPLISTEEGTFFSFVRGEKHWCRYSS